MKRSRRELSIDIVVDKGIFKNNLITLFPYLTSTFRKSTGLSKTGVSFYDFMMKDACSEYSHT